MDLLTAIKERHSVRSFQDKKIDDSVKQELATCIEKCNQESGLHMQLVLNEPKAFSGFMARYGKFSNANHYIAVVGKKENDVAEKCGYYGEKVVIKAQQLGLNTCWVGLTYSKVKDAFTIATDEKVYFLIAIGYGVTQGVPHKSKPKEAIMDIKEGTMPPDWFLNGIDAVLLAPTALKQQKFIFSFNGNHVSAKAKVGIDTKTDLGIAKYHFEIGAGCENFQWEEA